MINFAMTVDDQIERVRIVGTAKDTDQDGVLDWSELRRAVRELSKPMVRAHCHPQSYRQFVTPTLCNLHSSTLRLELLLLPRRLLLCLLLNRVALWAPKHNH